jgi:hypothetical protein
LRLVRKTKTKFDGYLMRLWESSKKWEEILVRATEKNYELYEFEKMLDQKT